jgi:predicted GIY-YIG superfamily endonuclease/N-acetylglutamate synthase-like GNAT family acetyltransferase
MSYIYVLHFCDKLAHAQHYVGCTGALKARLTAHANGAGANITRVLHERGIEWTLGGLMTTTHANMRRLERQLKNIANSDRYCELCTKQTKRLPETTPFAIAAVPFPVNSWQLRTGVKLPKDMTVRLTTEQDGPEIMEQIKHLMRADKDALGFIPAAGQQGLNTLVARGRIALVQAHKEILGYSAYTINMQQDTTTIHQCCVRDDVRLMGLGEKLVKLIRESHPDTDFIAKVRDDLAANHFWQAIGFTQILQQPHKTSGNIINHYRLHQIEE